MRSDFVANVSHEIRTPLTVVHGYLESLQDSPDEALTPWKHIFLQMEYQTKQMQRIVDDLLLLSRLEMGDKRSEDAVVVIQTLLSTVIDGARWLSSEQLHRFTLDIDEKLMLQGQPQELESAFSNLI